MKFNWIKKGKIFQAQGQTDWMYSHTTPIAAVPLQDCIRLYFSTRSKIDNEGNFISYPAYVELSYENPLIVKSISPKPILKFGGIGSFDEFGIMIAKPIFDNNELYMYYMGWQRLGGKTAPYQVMLGLAISKDLGVTFKKVSEGPILGIDIIDPISIGNVSVIKENGLWKMWYTTFTDWALEGIKPTPEYNIKYAISKDGVHWEKTGIVCIEKDNRGGVATPSVLKIGDQYHMWFGYRPAYDDVGNIQGYKIGYAKSNDGISWTRNDSLSGISTSDEGWDSKMVCYPHVVEVKGKLLMFYCGNGFGENGFGYAEMTLN